MLDKPNYNYIIWEYAVVISLARSKAYKNKRGREFKVQFKHAGYRKINSSSH